MCEFMGPIHLYEFMGPTYLCEFMGPTYLCEFMGPTYLCEFMGPIPLLALLFGNLGNMGERIKLDQSKLMKDVCEL